MYYSLYYRDYNRGLECSLQYHSVAAAAPQRRDVGCDVATLILLLLLLLLLLVVVVFVLFSLLFIIAISFIIIIIIFIY